MFVVDTNVLIYAANDRSPFHGKSRQLLEGWRAGSLAWFLTWGICYEFLRVCTHPSVLGPPWTAQKAWEFLDSLFASASLTVLTPTDRHAAVLAQIISESPHLSGNVLYDTQTAVLMREHGVRRIYTRDTDFHRFLFLEPMDPIVQKV